jgi:hypothetical protein
LADALSDHSVESVQGRGWAGVKNGELLHRAAGTCDAFLTLDSNLEYQQQLSRLTFGVVVVRARSSRMLHVRLLIPAILEALNGIKPGEVRRIGEPAGPDNP